MPKRSSRSLVFGLDQMASVNYRRLLALVLFTLLFPALVDECLPLLGTSVDTGWGAYVHRLMFIGISVGFFLVNRFIAITFAREHTENRWLVPLVNVTGLFGLAYVIPARWLPTDVALLVRDVVGDTALAVLGGTSVYAIAYDLMRSVRPTSREILGSVALYAMSGITMSYVYGLIGTLTPEAFSERLVVGATTREALIYFSMITQTTVGYGEMYPIGTLARNVTAIHGAFGMLYPAVIVARLINAYMHPMEEDEG